MNLLLPPWLHGVIPARAAVSRAERLRSAFGALIGIGLTGAVSAWVLGPSAAALWLIAPMGASAVLLFGVPASPLAQPWSIVGGNLVAALVGVGCARWIDAPVAAAAAAIGIAIAAMFWLRCLHPPSGAIALTAVLGGAPVQAAGYGFVLAPVMLNSLLLLAVAVVYNRSIGRRYPHLQAPEPTPARPQNAAASGFTAADLQTVLKAYDQVLDISSDDLEELLHRTEAQAFRRRFGETRCADIMSGDPQAVQFGTELGDAWDMMRSRGFQALPVIDRARRVIGIVTRSDFLRHAELREQAGIGARLRAFLQRTAHTHSDKPEVVGQIMSHPAHTAPANASIAELVPLMSRGGVRRLPVVDAERRLVGWVTQADLVGALFQRSLMQVAPGAPSAG